MEHWTFCNGFSCNRVSSTEVFKVISMLMIKGIWIIYAFGGKYMMCFLYCGVHCCSTPGEFESNSSAGVVVVPDAWNNQ